MLRRVYRREKWWKAHREHVYQRLTGLGANRTLVTVLVGVLSALICVASAPGVPAGLGLVAVVAILAAYLASPNMML